MLLNFLEAVPYAREEFLVIFLSRHVNKEFLQIRIENGSEQNNSTAPFGEPPVARAAVFLPRTEIVLFMGDANRKQWKILNTNLLNNVNEEQGKRQRGNKSQRGSKLLRGYTLQNSNKQQAMNSQRQISLSQYKEVWQSSHLTVV